MGRSRRSSNASAASSEGTPTVRVLLGDLMGGESAAADSESIAWARARPGGGALAVGKAAPGGAAGPGRGSAGVGSFTPSEERGRTSTASETSAETLPSGRSSGVSTRSYVSSVSLEDIVREVERGLGTSEAENLPRRESHSRSEAGASAARDVAEPDDGGGRLMEVPQAIPGLSGSKSAWQRDSNVEIPPGFQGTPPETRAMKRSQTMFSTPPTKGQPPRDANQEVRRSSTASPGRSPLPRHPSNVRALVRAPAAAAAIIDADANTTGAIDAASPAPAAAAEAPTLAPVVRSKAQMRRSQSSKKVGGASPGPGHAGGVPHPERPGSAEKRSAKHRRIRSSESLPRSPSDLSEPPQKKMHKRSLSGMEAVQTQNQKQKRHSAGAVVLNGSPGALPLRLETAGLSVDVGGSPPPVSPGPVQAQVSILNLDNKRPTVISTASISIEELVHESARGGALEPDVVAADKDTGGADGNADMPKPGDTRGEKWWHSLFLCGCYRGAAQ